MKLFDLDGTLIDSNGVWQDVDYRFLAAHRLSATDEYMAVIGQTTLPTAARFTKSYYRLDMSPEAIMLEWLALVTDAYKKHIPLKPGAWKYLVQEAIRGETLVLVTACAPDLCRAALDRLELSNLFHHQIFAQDLGLEKQDPNFFRQVLKQLRVSPAQCTLYDDSPDSCANAKALGLKVVGILDPLHADEADRMAKLCDRCITDFTELLDT